MSERKLKRTKSGVVLRRSGDKTVVVEVERMVKHPVFGKYQRRHCRYHVHDERNQCQSGDFVTIMEGRPMSRTKRWTFQSLVKRVVPVAETTIEI